MLAHTSLQLIKELKRSSQSHKLPPYNEEKVRSCLEEMKTLYDANYREVASVYSSSEGNQGGKIQSVLVRHAILERNKRCLLAYHHSRLMYIKALRWHFGTVLPKEIRRSLSDAEHAWFMNYCSMLANFMQADIGRGGAGGLDLTHFQVPPKSLLIEVRCLTDFGRFTTEDGATLSLTKDSNHLMHRSDCETLIRQGVLEHIFN